MERNRLCTRQREVRIRKRRMVWDRLAEYSVSDNDIAPIFLALDANFRFIEFRTTWHGLNGRFGNR